MKGKLRMSPYRRAREELLTGKAATRIQAMTDLEAAIRADQRRIDTEAAPVQPTPPTGPDYTHDYRSTACGHLTHTECRLTCKFCGAPCQCDCHDAPVSAAPPDGFRWHTLGYCPGETTCPIHGRNEASLRTPATTEEQL